MGFVITSRFNFIIKYCEWTHFCSLCIIYINSHIYSRKQYINEKLICCSLESFLQALRIHRNYFQKYNSFRSESTAFCVEKKFYLTLKKKNGHNVIEKQNLAYTFRSLTNLRKVKQRAENRDGKLHCALIHILT